MEDFLMENTVEAKLQKEDLRVKVLHEIANDWNIEAKQESTDYFYSTGESQELLMGKKYFVIGRKGTGKTAIAEHISSQHDENHFSEKLSFKNFPFNYLYSLENTRYTAPNQYITIWKYLVYSSICKMMIKNKAIDAKIVAQLRKIYPDDVQTSLARMVEEWTATDFGVEVFGCGISGKREVRQKKELSWIEKCDILEDVIKEYIDQGYYYIIIDELDEDYREFESNKDRETYLKLLTSLFKAVQDIRTTFKNKSHIFPIIFLRTDIYTLLKDSDKNKWRAFKVDMDWTEDKIQKMLTHRISVAAGTQYTTFNDAWNLLFNPAPVQMGNQNRNRMSKFDFITRSTHLRPRDYIQYLIECANATLSIGQTTISSDTVKAVDDLFSDYLRDEIVDEIYSVLPEINEIFEILSQIRKQTFSPTEFVDVYESYVSTSRIQDRGAENILRMLFEFSVIGNQPKAHKQPIFKYQTVRARFKFKENIMIHRGLYKALQIY